MRIDVQIDGDLIAMMRKETESGKEAVTRTMRAVGGVAKAGLRGQVVAAGLGTRLANTIRMQLYPKDGHPSLKAAATVFSNAPTIVGAHEEGPTIVSANGFWLAIPLPAAGKSGRGGRISPGEWEQRTGRQLTFIYRAGRSGLLVDTGKVKAGARTQGKDGFSRAARGFKNRTVPIFALVRQVRLKKRLNMLAVADQAMSRAASMIVANWK